MQTECEVVLKGSLEGRKGKRARDRERARSKKEKKRVGGASLKGIFAFRTLGWPGHCLGTSCQMTGQACIILSTCPCKEDVIRYWVSSVHCSSWQHEPGGGCLEMRGTIVPCNGQPTLVRTSDTLKSDYVCP